MNHFYTYIYLDPRKKGPFTYGEYVFEYEPFYVGKGSYEQYKYHLTEKCQHCDPNTFKVRKINKIRKITNDEPIIVKYKENIIEEEAFKLEISLIDTIGRYDLKKGPLVNLTDGGEGTSNPSKETRKKLSESSTGRKMSIETRRKMSISKLGNKNPQFGKPKTKKQKDILRRKLIGRTISEETKKKISIKNKGKRITNETKRKISNSNSNPSQVTRRKMSASAKGKLISESTKNKIRLKAIERWKDSDFRCKMIISLTGKFCSHKTKLKISQKNKGKIISDKIKLKISKSLQGRPSPFKGKKMSIESIEKIRLSKLGNIDSEETKKRKSIAIKKWWKERKKNNVENI